MNNKLILGISFRRLDQYLLFCALRTHLIIISREFTTKRIVARDMIMLPFLLGSAKIQNMENTGLFKILGVTFKFTSIRIFVKYFLH